MIIAEIGINHEGDPATCFRLIEAAAEAGADAIKLQTMDADENYVPGTESHTIFSGAALSEADTAAAFKMSRDLGMEPLTTCGDFKTLRWVERLDPAAHKISSGLISHLPLIRAAAETGRPLIMSLGMGGIEAADAAVKTAREAGCKDICLLQCTSVYPAPLDALNLRAMDVLRQAFDCHVGFSDHSIGWEAAALSVAAGARVIEKHFSLDPERPGFDHRLSLTPAGLAELVSAVRRAETILGNADAINSETKVEVGRRFLRSMVARTPIAAGEKLSLENVGFMRTQPDARGLEPARWADLEGRRVIRDMNKYQSIQIEDLAE